MGTQIRTLQAMKDRADRPEDLPAAGEFLDMKIDTGRKGISLRAAKLLHLLIKHTGADACVDKTHAVPVATLNSTMHMTLDEFVVTIEELMDVKLRLRVKDGEAGPEIWLDRLVQSVRRTESDHDQAIIRYQLSAALRKILENSIHWGILSRKALLAFESRYALRLYEMVALRIGLERTKQDFSIVDLRERLGVPQGKLLKWDALRRKAIDPAVAEVNQLSGFRVDYTPVKKGRSFVGITLHWKLAPAPERAQIQRELESSRIGRSARRIGRDEKVLDLVPTLVDARPRAFPYAGSIAYTVWADAAKAALPRPMPDIDHVAERFRDFAGRKGILLSRQNIEQLFISFCRNWSTT
jgi:hypothetical protein